MIERMKKLLLLIYNNSRETFLENLQQLGVVHIEVDRTVQNEEILNLREKIGRITKIEKLLSDNFKKEIANAEQKKYNKGIDELIDRIEEVNSSIENLNNEISSLNKEIGFLEPWGDFDSNIIEELKKRGLFFYFFTISSSQFKKLDLSDYIAYIISEKDGNTFFVIISGEEKEFDFGVDPIRIEGVRLKDLIDKREAALIDLSKKKEELFFFIKYFDFIKKNKEELEDKYDFLIADLNMSEEVFGHVLAVKGWFPARLIRKVEGFLQKEDVVYVIEDPKEEDNIPVLLRNGPVARLFEPITKMHSLPQYFELDPTPFFAPFFAAFFGLCLGDAGYGMVLLLAVISAFVFVRNKKLYPTLVLGLILSSFTVIAGFVLNTFFGEKVSELVFIPEKLKQGIIFSNMQDQMAFALMLGVVQVLFGIFLQVINKIRQKGFLGGLQPIGTILLLVSIIILGISGMSGDFKIGPIPVKSLIISIPNYYNVGFILLILGIFLVLFFNNIDKNIFIRPAIGLWELYQLVTGVPGDILSYIRLFALGLAGGLLGNAFNQIAFMLRDSIPVFGLNYALMVLLMLVGHGVNLALAALGAFVHPLRLVLLEFYKALSFTGGGMAYQPFKNRVK